MSSLALAILSIAACVCWGQPGASLSGIRGQAARQLAEVGASAALPLPLLPPAIAIPGAPPSSAGRASRRPRVLFSDEADISARLVEAIDASQTTVETALFGITLPAVADALVRAKERGVSVRVVMNQNHAFPSRTKEVQRLVDNGIDLRTLRGTRSYGVQHNKIGIFDGKLLKMGSFNWTFAANNYNYENALFTDDPAAVAAFASYWRYMWDLGRPFSAGPTDEVPYASYPKPPACPRGPTFHGVSFPVCSFSPLGATEAKLRAAIETSRSTIDAASYSFYSQNLAQALVAARDRGVRVRILMDKEMGKKTAITRFLLEHGMDVRWMTGRGKGAMHHKFAVFDGAFLETGSFNWTANAENNDFENVLFSADADAARSYAAKFEELFGRAKTPSPAELPAPAIEPSPVSVE